MGRRSVGGVVRAGRGGRRSGLERVHVRFPPARSRLEWSRSSWSFVLRLVFARVVNDVPERGLVRRRTAPARFLRRHHQHRDGVCVLQDEPDDPPPTSGNSSARARRLFAGRTRETKREPSVASLNLTLGRCDDPVNGRVALRLSPRTQRGVVVEVKDVRAMVARSERAHTFARFRPGPTHSPQSLPSPLASAARRIARRTRCMRAPLGGFPQVSTCLSETSMPLERLT